MASSSTSPFSRGRMMSTLTTIQHSSALVFGSFLFVHLAAPSVAVVAPKGESLELATKTMIIGRVYYQNIITEPLVVYGAITVHVISSFVKKALQVQRRYERRRHGISEEVKGYTIPDQDSSAEVAITPSTETKKLFPLLSTLSVHTMTGLILIPTVAIHSYLNRISPASSQSPINELSPSELDYTFVTYGFLTKSTAWRYITWTLYIGLLGAGAVHVVGGTDKIARRLRTRKELSKIKKEASTMSLPTSSVSSNRANMKQYDAKRRAQRGALVNGAVSLAGIAWLSVGIYRMAMEDTLSTSTSWAIKRLDACYASVWPYNSLK